MPEKRVFRAILILIFIFLAMFALGRFFDYKIVVGSRLLSMPSGFIFGKLNYFKSFLVEFRNLSALTVNNINLKSQNTELMSRLGDLQALRDENEHLAKALNLSPKMATDFISANVFTSAATLNGLNFLINKGINDGIKEGQVVITSDKALVGQVSKVNNSFAAVVSVIDEKFKITARDINTGTSGIAIGALRNGLELTLISQEDEIKEGDIIVSSGDDLFPAGLVIGSVSFVEVRTGETFKKVRIKPIFSELPFAKVLIIKR